METELYNCISLTQDFKNNEGYVDQNDIIYLERKDLEKDDFYLTGVFWADYIVPKGRDFPEIGDSLVLRYKPKNKKRAENTSKFYNAEIVDNNPRVKITQKKKPNGDILFKQKTSKFLGTALIEIL